MYSSKYFFLINFMLIILIPLSCIKREEKASLNPPPVESTPPQEENKKTTINSQLNQPNLNNNLTSTSTETEKPNQNNIANANSDLKNTTLISGNVVTLRQGNLSFQVKGQIKNERVNVGSKFKKGDVLATLDDRNFTYNLKIYQQSIDLAKISVSQTKRDLHRTQTLMQQNATTTLALEQAQDAHQSALLKLEQAETNFEIAQKALRDTQLIAPYDGVVTAKLKYEGEFVSEGLNVFTVLEDQNIEISLLIPEAQISIIKIGMTLKIRIPSAKAEGTLKVLRIVPSISPTSRTFEIRGISEDLKKVLVPGQFVEGEF